MNRPDSRYTPKHLRREDPDMSAIPQADRPGVSDEPVMYSVRNRKGQLEPGWSVTGEERDEQGRLKVNVRKSAGTSPEGITLYRKRQVNPEDIIGYEEASVAELPVVEPQRIGNEAITRVTEEAVNHPAKIIPRTQAPVSPAISRQPDSLNASSKVVESNVEYPEWRLDKEEREKLFGFLRDHPVGVYFWRPGSSPDGQTGFQVRTKHSPTENYGTMVNQLYALQGIDHLERDETLAADHRHNGVAEVISFRPLEMREYHDVLVAEEAPRKFGRFGKKSQPETVRKTYKRPGTIGDVTKKNDNSPAYRVTYQLLSRNGLGRIDDSREGATFSIGAVVNEEGVNHLRNIFSTNPRHVREFSNFLLEECIGDSAEANSINYPAMDRNQAIKAIRITETPKQPVQKEELYT